MKLSGLTVGSCLLDFGIARIIRATCLKNGQSFMPAPRNFTVEINAVTSGGDFVLHIGDPHAAPEPPSWREYLDARGVDIDSDKSIQEWCLDEIGIPLNESGLDISPEEPINDSTYEAWLDGEFTLHESSMALAYHYLGSLDLSDGRPVEGDSLGDLSFIEGPFPGSNLTYVSAPDYATLACLQSRLNRLGELVRINIIVDY